jgi:hypothetical protein
MLREWQTVNQAALSPHEMHCHQYLAIRCRYLTEAKLWSIIATTSDRPRMNFERFLSSAELPANDFHAML